MRTMTMLLMIFLVSCVHSIKSQILCDISFEKNRCRCRLYDLEKMEALEEPINHPLIHCEGVSGFFLEDIAKDIKPDIKRNIRYCRDLED